MAVKIISQRAPAAVDHPCEICGVGLADHDRARPVAPDGIPCLAWAGEFIQPAKPKPVALGKRETLRRRNINDG